MTIRLERRQCGVEIANTAEIGEGEIFERSVAVFALDEHIKDTGHTNFSTTSDRRAVEVHIFDGVYPGDKCAAISIKSR